MDLLQDAWCPHKKRGDAQSQRQRRRLLARATEIGAIQWQAKEDQRLPRPEAEQGEAACVDIVEPADTLASGQTCRAVRTSTSVVSRLLRLWSFCTRASRSHRSSVAQVSTILTAVRGLGCRWGEDREEGMHLLASGVGGGMGRVSFYQGSGGFHRRNAQWTNCLLSLALVAVCQP